MGLLENVLKNEDIICVSTSDWEKPYGSKQQIMSVLAGSNRILYVESQSSFLHFFKNPRIEFKRFIRWGRGVLRRGNIFLFTPPPLFPFGNYSLIINRINQKILLRAVRNVAQRIGFRNPLLWIYTINSCSFVSKFGEKLSVYHCIDDFPSEKPNIKRQWLMNRLETELLGKADIVIACSKSLCEERKRHRPDIYFLRNGVNFTFGLQAQNESFFPKELRGLRHPVIGFIGTLNSKIDIELILFLSRQKRDWQFIFIGDILISGKDKKALKNLSNVYLLKFINHDLLPCYIKVFDVCFIPYRVTEFNRHVFPLKTLEYLAMGKPVVSTYLPELEELKDVVKLSRTRDDFLNNIDLFIKETTGHGESARKEAAARYSWEEKVGWLERLIQKEISKRFQNK